MTAFYQGKAEALDSNFLEDVKAAFKDKEIEITVYERDETAYLLRAPATVSTCCVPFPKLMF